MSNALPTQTANYIGRFAPSPSGPLHFGSLIAAVGSYLQAKSQHGQWLLRIEDIDTPRVQAGADSAIMRTLEAYGLHWDGPVVYQSQRLARYQHVFSELQQRGLLYGCQCSRRLDLLRLQRSLAQRPLPLDEQRVPVHFSAGLAQWQPGEPAEALLRRADASLYAAKRVGKNRVQAADAPR